MWSFYGVIFLHMAMVLIVGALLNEKRGGDFLPEVVLLGAHASVFWESLLFVEEKWLYSVEKQAQFEFFGFFAYSTWDQLNATCQHHPSLWQTKHPISEYKTTIRAHNLDCATAKHYPDANHGSPSSLKFCGIEEVMMSMRGGDVLKKLAQREIFWINTLNTLTNGLNDDFSLKCFLGWDWL